MYLYAQHIPRPATSHISQLSLWPSGYTIREQQHFTMASDTPTPTQSTGHCLCNGIEYTIIGTKGPTLLCFCPNCQHAGGSAFSWVLSHSEATLETTKGEELLRKYEDRATKSGNVMERWFCSGCVGDLLYSVDVWPLLTRLYADVRVASCS